MNYAQEQHPISDVGELGPKSSEGMGYATAFQESVAAWRGKGVRIGRYGMGGNPIDGFDRRVRLRVFLVNVYETVEVG